MLMLLQSGYNSEWYLQTLSSALKWGILMFSRGIPVLETVLPTKEQRDKGCAQRISIMTIWFGERGLIIAAVGVCADGR